MSHSPWPRAGLLAFAAVALVGLAACGGGGGDGAVPGGDGGNGGSGTAHGGRVWRSEYSTQQQATLSETVAGDGSARTVGAGKAVPWPDGSRYATTDWDTSATEVRIVDTASGTQLHGVEFEGYVRDLKPSPLNADRVAVRQGAGTTSSATWAIADFASRAILDRFVATSAGFSWLPDGQYLVVSATGEVRRGAVGQASTVVGQLALPSGRSVANAWVNRQGTAMVVRLDLRPATGQSESDLWIANLDGSNLQRYTATRMTTFAAWSPDGQSIAFDVDTGAWCSGSSCQGICEVWHAGVNAREIRATTTSGDAQPFNRRGTSGSQRMGCTLLGWTP